MWWIAAAAVVGGIANYLAQTSAEERARLLQDKQFQDWMALQVPDPEEQKLVLERFVSAGNYDPILEKNIKQDPSAFEQIAVDSQHQQAQDRALSELQDIGNQGGLRLQDKAALQEAMLGSQARDRGNREAITADMSRRGLGGSGFELQSQLAAQQMGADRNANNSLKVASMAQDRALQAIMGGGEMASKYRDQSFNEQARKATAADDIARFNTQNMIGNQQRNVASQNQARLTNLSNQQDILNRNTSLSNSEQEHNKGLLQQKYQNQVAHMSGANGMVQGLAQSERNKGQMEGNLYTNSANAFGGAMAANENRNWQSQENQKNREAMQGYGSGNISKQTMRPGQGNFSVMDNYFTDEEKRRRGEIG